MCTPVEMANRESAAQYNKEQIGWWKTAKESWQARSEKAEDLLERCIKGSLYDTPLGEEIREFLNLNS